MHFDRCFMCVGIPLYATGIFLFPKTTSLPTGSRGGNGRTCACKCRARTVSSCVKAPGCRSSTRHPEHHTSSWRGHRCHSCSPRCCPLCPPRRAPRTSVAQSSTPRDLRGSSTRATWFGASARGTRRRTRCVVSRAQGKLAASLAAGARLPHPERVAAARAHRQLCRPFRNACDSHAC